MGLRIRKGERPDVEAVLQQEGDLDDIVTQVFDTCTELSAARDWYTLVVFDAPVVYLFGPYESEAVAKRAANSLVSTRRDEGMRYEVRKLYKIQEGL